MPSARHSERLESTYFGETQEGLGRGVMAAKCPGWDSSPSCSDLQTFVSRAHGALRSSVVTGLASTGTGFRDPNRERPVSTLLEAYNSLTL